MTRTFVSTSVIYCKTKKLTNDRTETLFRINESLYSKLNAIRESYPNSDEIRVPFWEFKKSYYLKFVNSNFPSNLFSGGDEGSIELDIKPYWYKKDGQLIKGLSVSLIKYDFIQYQRVRCPLCDGIVKVNNGCHDDDITGDENCTTCQIMSGDLEPEKN